MTNLRVSSAGSRFRSRAAGEGLSSMLGPGAKTVQSGREVRIREGDFKALLISNSVNCCLGFFFPLICSCASSHSSPILYS